jgi:3-hydroxymyristoyl/3-hydroxydecanoyl-(acyl carrier protein) dehydratase
MQVSQDPWIPLKETWVTPSGRWEGRIRFGSTSEWFSGHFEECPLLPGVAILAVVVETVKRQGQKQGRALELSSLSGVRFKRFVFPDEELHISVARMPSGDKARLDFLVVCQGETVAQGELDMCEEGLGE